MFYTGCLNPVVWGLHPARFSVLLLPWMGSVGKDFVHFFYFKVQKTPQNTDWKDSSTGVHQRSVSLEGKIGQTIYHMEPSCNSEIPSLTEKQFPVNLPSMQHLQASSDALTGSKLTDHCSFPTNRAWWRQASFQNSQAPVVVHMINSKFREFPCHVEVWIPGRTEKLTGLREPNKIVSRMLLQKYLPQLNWLLVELVLYLFILTHF